MGHWKVCVKLDKETVTELDVHSERSLTAAYTDSMFELLSEAYSGGPRTRVFCVSVNRFIYAKKES